MRLTEAVPWMQQYEELRKRKQGIEPEEGALRPKAWQNNLASGKKHPWQQGLSLSDMLEAALPGGLGGLGNEVAIGADGRQQPSEAMSKQLARIGAKLKSGKELNDREMQLLEKYSPELYQEAKQIKAEREQYERELKNCRSQEDVDRLKMSKLSQFSAEIQAISRSNMSKADKAAAMEAVGRRMANAEKVYRDFVESGAYDALPEKRPELEPKEEEVALPEEQVPETEVPEETEAPEQAPQEGAAPPVETGEAGEPTEAGKATGPAETSGAPVPGESKPAGQAAKAEGRAPARKAGKAESAGQGKSAGTYGPTGQTPKRQEAEPAFFSISI